MQAQNSSATDKSGQCDHVTSQWTKSELLTQVKEFSTRTSSACSLPKLQDWAAKEYFTYNNTGITSNPTQHANVNRLRAWNILDKIPRKHFPSANKK